MAQLMTVRLTRNDGQPWGFRLQGGKDFGSPLALQKVSVSYPTAKRAQSDIRNQLQLPFYKQKHE